LGYFNALRPFGLEIESDEEILHWKFLQQSKGVEYYCSNRYSY